VKRIVIFDYVRLLAAVAVYVGHVRNSWYETPSALAYLLSEHAVHAFFLTSGFLIYQSADRLSTQEYLLRRVFRIWPGLTTCLFIISFALAPIVSRLFDNSPNWRDSFLFFLRNLLLLPAWQTTILDSLPPDLPSRAWNPPLWTLFFEVSCYLAALAFCRIHDKVRSRVYVLTLACLAALYISTQAEVLTFWNSAAKLSLSFVLGTSFAIGRRFGLVTTASVLVFSIGIRDWTLLSISILAIVLVDLAPHLVTVMPPLRCDLSFGIYIWHWPLVQLVWSLCRLLDVNLSWVQLGLVTFPAVVGVSIASWHLVESPAIKFARRSEVR